MKMTDQELSAVRAPLGFAWATTRPNQGQIGVSDSEGETTTPRHPSPNGPTHDSRFLLAPPTGLPSRPRPPRLS
jgi:hypothetical protein